MSHNSCISSTNHLSQTDFRHLYELVSRLRSRTRGPAALAEPAPAVQRSFLLWWRCPLGRLQKREKGVQVKAMPVYSLAYCLLALLHTMADLAVLRDFVAVLCRLHSELCTLPGSAWPDTLALASRQALFWLMSLNWSTARLLYRNHACATCIIAVTQT